MAEWQRMRTKDGKVAVRPEVTISGATLELPDYAADQPLDELVHISHRDSKNCAFLGDRVLLTFSPSEFHYGGVTLSGPLDVLLRLVDEASAKLAARQQQLDRAGDEPFPAVEEGEADVLGDLLAAGKLDGLPVLLPGEDVPHSGLGDGADG